MERLTKVDGIGQNDLIRCFGCGEEKSGPNFENCGLCEDGWRKALDRLAAYEDTGLEPEEVAELITPEGVEMARLLQEMFKDGSAQHVLDLLHAEQEGRLVVLLCSTKK